MMKHFLITTAFLACINCLTINCSFGQANSTTPVSAVVNDKYTKDVSSESAIVTALYDVISGESGEVRDWERFKYLFGKDALLIPTNKSNTGVFSYRTMTPDDYITMFSTRVKTGFFEKELKYEVNSFGTVAEIQSNIVAKTPDPQVLGDLKAAITWAGKNGGDLKKVAVTGFCWGGRITWLSATMPEVKAGVAWYGRLVGDKTANNPKQPVEIAADLKAPVLGLYGSADTGIPLDTVEQMKAALSKASSNPAAKASKFEIYLEAPHAFHADYRATYREGPAKDAWAKCLAWFKQHGVA